MELVSLFADIMLLLCCCRHGHVRRPYVGITMAEVNSSRMTQLRTSCPDFPTDVSSGIVVTRVTPGSPAAAAGLREDDVIVGILPGGETAATAAGGNDGGAIDAGLSVSSLADALKAAIGGSLELLVVREQQQQGQQGSNGSRYAYVTVAMEPVEAPTNQSG